MASVLGLYPHGRPVVTTSDGIDDLTTSSSSSSTDSAMSTPPSSTSAPGSPPGPEHYEERRKMWLASPASDSGSGSGSGSGVRRSEGLTNRTKLETLLARRGGGADEEAWHSGVKSVYEGLMSGGRLKKRLPLNTVIKVLKAGWMHDGTWPNNLPDPIPSPLSSMSHLPHVHHATQNHIR